MASALTQEEPKPGRLNPYSHGSSEQFLTPKDFKIDERHNGVVLRQVKSTFAYKTKRRTWRHWVIVCEAAEQSYDTSALVKEASTFDIYEDFLADTTDNKPSHILEPQDPFLRELISEANAAKYWCHIPDYCEKARNNRSRRYWEAGVFDCREVWTHSGFIRNKFLELQKLRQAGSARNSPNSHKSKGKGGKIPENHLGEDDENGLVQKIAVLQGFIDCFLDDLSFAKQYGDQERPFENISACTHKACLQKAQNEKVLKKISKLCLFRQRLGTFLDIPEFLTMLQKHKRIGCPYDAFQALQARDEIGTIDPYAYFEDPGLCAQIEALNHLIRSIGVQCGCLQAKLEDTNCPDFTPAHERLLHLSKQPRRIRHNGAKSVHLVTHSRLPTNLNTIMSTAMYSFACHTTLRKDHINSNTSEVFAERRAFIADLRRWKRLVKQKDLQAYLDATYILWGSGCSDKADWLSDGSPDEEEDGWYVEQVVNRMAEEFGVTTEDTFCGSDTCYDGAEGENDTPDILADATVVKGNSCSCSQPPAHYLGQDFPGAFQPCDESDFYSGSDIIALNVLIVAGVIVLFAVIFLKFISTAMALTEVLSGLALQCSSLPSFLEEMNAAFVRDVIGPLVGECGDPIGSELQKELWTLMSWFSDGVFGSLHDVYSFVLNRATLFLSSNADLLRRFSCEANSVFQAFESSAYGACLAHHKSSNCVTDVLDSAPLNLHDGDSIFPSAPQTPLLMPQDSYNSFYNETIFSSNPQTPFSLALEPEPEPNENIAFSSTVTTPSLPTSIVTTPSYPTSLVTTPSRPTSVMTTPSIPTSPTTAATTAKKFKCPDCDTSFDYSQNLRRHQNQYHSRPSSTSSSPSAAEGECGGYICRLEFNGKECGAQMGGRKDNIRKHERRIHGGVVSEWLIPRAKRRRVS